MTDSSEPEVVTPDEVTPAASPGRNGDSADATDEAVVEESESTEVEPRESITEPGKVMRIGSMVKQLLEEVRQTELDVPSRERLAEVYERSIVELSEALSPDLQEELRDLTLPFGHDEAPTEAELRVAKAQLVGWLEGLFHGIQASLMAQQFAAQQQLKEMRQLPQQGGPDDQDPRRRPGPPQTGTYL